jgi:hypothetical protein
MTQAGFQFGPALRLWYRWREPNPYTRKDNTF